MKPKIVYPLVVSAICWLSWYLVRTEYKFTAYPIAGCKSGITLVEYTALFERGAVLVGGSYHLNQVPAQNCLVLPITGGFDAYYECVVTCEKGSAMVNYYGDVPTQLLNTGALITRKVDGETYQKVRSDVNNVIVKVY